MAEYGHTLDPNDSFPRMRVRNLMSNYFGDPELTKVEITDQGNSVYAARVDLVVNVSRYLICICTGIELSIGARVRLSALPWHSLQTRQINDEISCGTFLYTPNGEAPFNSGLVLIERKKKMTLYNNLEFGFRVGLLHRDPRSEYEYPDFGTLATALETYEAMIII